MIRHYSSPHELSKLGWPPRIIVSMALFGDGFKLGANEHYSIDSDLKECCFHFFQKIIREYPEYKIDMDRSKLEIRYVNLPVLKGSKND